MMSIDTELAWSAIHHDRISPDLLTADRAAAERDIVDGLLGLFARRDVSATWAVVGHLFLDQCRPDHGRAHPEIGRPDYAWLDHDWFEPDPGSDVASDPMWYGPDLVEMIRRATPAQEIGSHSFSHLIVGEPGCGQGAFEDDLAACTEIAGDRGIDLRSFVYPRNSIGHLEVLARAGFTAYRGHRPIPFEEMGALRRAVSAVVDKISPQPGSAVFPERVGSLWNLPATNLFAPFDRPTGLPLRMWVAQQIKRLRHAARHRSMYHLWFHPHNLLDDTGQALAALDSILEAVDELREQGSMVNLTMSGLTSALDGAP